MTHVIYPIYELSTGVSLGFIAGQLKASIGMDCNYILPIFAVAQYILATII